MIILVTGASHTGKTLLAQRLLEKYKYPYISIDHLKMGLIRSGNTKLTPKDDDLLTKYLWNIVIEIIKTAIENKQNLIVEGCYIPFNWKNDFDERYLPFIKFICLAMTDEYIENNFEKIIAHESDIESRLVEADFNIDELKECNRLFIEKFGSAGENIVLINDDYDSALTNFIDFKFFSEKINCNKKIFLEEKVMEKIISDLQVLVTELSQQADGHLIQSRIFASQGFEKLAKNYEEHAEEERGYVVKFIDRIIDLGGEVKLEDKKAAPLFKDVEEYLKYDLKVSKDGLKWLAEVVKSAQCDLSTFEILAEYYKDEEKDMYENEQQLELIEMIGKQNWLTKQI